ncbi:MAG: hypothetical protein K2H30_05585, partial [Clostridia bacterium]|nr:hypothetical protein [Clostridia bacterium]
MNNITSVVSADGGKERVSKSFEIAVPQTYAQITAADKTFSVPTDGFAVIPPLTQYRVDCGKATVITVEKALLPFREITVIPDVRGEIAKIAEQARFYAQS